MTVFASAFTRLATGFLPPSLLIFLFGACMQLFDPRSIAVTSGHFIGGRVVPDTARLSVLRPSDGQEHAGLPLADASTVDAAVQNAWQAWRSSDWARRAPRERARVMRRWADLIEADGEHLATLEAVCSTRPVRDAMAGHGIAHRTGGAHGLQRGQVLPVGLDQVGPAPHHPGPLARGTPRPVTAAPSLPGVLHSGIHGAGVGQWQAGVLLPVRRAQHAQARGVGHHTATDEVAAGDGNGAGIK